MNGELFDFIGMCLHLSTAYSDDRSQSSGWWLGQRLVGMWSLNMLFGPVVESNLE